MSVKIIQNRVCEKNLSLSSAYLSKLGEMMDKDDRVVEVDADLCFCMGPDILFSRPDKVINCGIQEANMIGVCAGMSAVGFIPYAHTFGCFMTRRVFDQIFVSGAYAKLNMKLIGSDPGVIGKYNGGTHMPFEDVGLMRLVPNAMVFDIADPVQLADVVEQIKDIFGVQYIRFPRKDKGVALYEAGSKFELGKGVVVREGNDAAIIASGIMVAEALDAADMLAAENISVRVVDMFTIKPIDKELIISSAEKTGAIVTAENHSIIGGLGSAVAEVLSENCPVPLARVGAEDRFGQVGDLDYLKKAYGMTKENIAEKVKATIARKK